MNKHRFFSIYGKVFFYTMLILIFVILIMFAFFSDQIKTAVEFTQRKQIADVFQPLLTQTSGKSEEDIIKVAEAFHEKNTSFEFCFEASDGRILYKTADFVMPQFDTGLLPPDNMLIAQGFLKTGKSGFVTHEVADRIQFISLTTSGIRLYVSGSISGIAIYNEFEGKTVIAVALVMLASIFAAAVFARRIARPIQKIAGDTKRMTQLEPVDAPDFRRDEIGQLADDVYRMYKTLQLTIGQLEIEIKREKEMEENQLHFFSAASHELKTPVAAASALLEGMLENIIEPADYPKYLRECLKLMREQGKLITEILEIVTLNSNEMTPVKKRVLLKEFIVESLPAYRALVDAKGQQIDVTVPENLFCVVDAKLLSKAFSNVVMNAIQNTPENGMLHIYTQTLGDKIRLCILNKDARIPEEILPKLFEPFYRADEARSRDQGRSGMGLTIVKKTLNLTQIPFALENTKDGVLFWMDLSTE